MATIDALSPRRRFWRRKGACNSSYFVPTGRTQSYSSGGGVPTQWYIPNLHGPVPPYPAVPQQPYPPPQPLPPQPASSRRSHSAATEEEELMQLAMAMSMSEAEPHAAAAAAAAVSQQRLPPLRRHSQPQARPPQRQGRHPRRADTLSDEALARALGDMYSEELANEQQLRELRSSGTPVPPLLRPSQPQRASQALPPRQPQHQLQSPTAQHNAHPPRLGGRVAAAAGSAFTNLPAPSPEAVGPPGFGRSLAPLLPSHAASAATGLSAGAAVSAAATVAAALAASAPQPAPMQPPQRPPLPPVRTHTAAPPSPAGQSAGGALQRLHSHSSSGDSGVPQRLLPSPSQDPDSSASSSDWFDFLAADTPPPGPTSADAAAAPADHSTANPLARQSQGPGARPDLQATPGTSAAYAADGTADGAVAPSITQRQLAEKLPDLIQLASPEPRPPLHLPASDASSQPPHLRTAASWPPPSAAGGAAGSWDQPQRTGLASADGAAAAAQSNHGAAAQRGGISGAALPETAAALQAQLQQRYAEQQAWWRQQLERQGYHQESQPQPQTYPQAWSQQPAGSQLQPQLEVVGQQASPDQTQGSVVPDGQAEQQQHGWQAASQVPWWQQRRQGQQRPWTPPEPPQPHAAEQPAASPVRQDSLQSAGDAQQQPWPPAQPVQLQQITGQQGAPEQPQAQAVSQVVGSQRVPGALWSTFFEFPADSELSDCHPALLQAAKLQQEAAATMAAAAAEDPAGRISPAHWHAMHLDIADAYLCPITQEVTEDPVIAADSFTYERSAIAAWLRHHDTSPMTNAALPNKELIPNHAARSAIRTLREAGILDPPPDD